MNILLFGPPGAGKGTQSALLVDRRKMRHLSSGDMFRAAIKNETTLGLEAKRYMNEGKLVPDAITIGMVGEELEKLSGADFILDGFPRTVTQAEALENLLQGLKLRIDKAIFVEVPSSLLLGRLTGRRVCKSCGATYHVDASPTKTPGVCDKCGGVVIQRDDDKEEVIATRLSAYEQSTRPLKDYYQSKGRLVTIDGTGSTAAVFERIERVLSP
ncbi:MAG: adenylate kinase [Bdellovibrionales bacterium]